MTTAPRSHLTNRRLKPSVALTIWKIRLDVIKKKVALPVPAHFTEIDHQLEDMQVAVIRAGVPEKNKRRREEMRFIHNFLQPHAGGFNFKISLSRDLLARTLAWFYSRILIFSNFPLPTRIFSLMKAALPERRSFICNYQRLTYHLSTFNTHKRYAETPLLFVPFFLYLRWNGGCIPYNKLQNAGRLRPKGFLFQASRTGHGCFPS